MGYLEQERSTHDRRSVSIRLTQKALSVVGNIRDLEKKIAGQARRGELRHRRDRKRLRRPGRVERTWTDYVHYGRRQ